MKDVCVDPLTRAEFDALSDFEKGYVSYVQAAWPESEVPDGRPDAVDLAEWDRGQQRATSDVQDMES